MLKFLYGAVTMGFVITGLFFFRFWRRTGDDLFLYFGVSFWLLAASQAMAVALDLPNEDRSWIYLLRLAGFILLIVAIISKNVRRPHAGDL